MPANEAGHYSTVHRHTADPKHRFGLAPIVS